MRAAILALSAETVMHKTPTRLQMMAHALTLAFMLYVSGMAQAQTQPVATVQSLIGQMEVQRGGTATAVSVAERGGLFDNDIVSTAANSKARLLFSNGSRILINANTIIEMTSPTPVSTGPDSNGAQSFCRLLKGEIFAQLRPGLAVQTRSATAAVRGTQFYLAVDARDVTTLVVVEGVVSFFNPFGAVSVSRAQQSTAHPGQAPMAPGAVSTFSSPIEWTIGPGFAAYVAGTGRNAGSNASTDPLDPRTHGLPENDGNESDASGVRSQIPGQTRRQPSGRSGRRQMARTILVALDEETTLTAHPWPAGGTYFWKSRDESLVRIESNPAQGSVILKGMRAGTTSIQVRYAVAGKATTQEADVVVFVRPIPIEVTWRQPVISK
jgi:hypothetical protein